MSDLHVVAAAIVRDGCVLAARRRRPARLAGGWEFPGGKVEPGEDEAAALVRECREELGVDVLAGPRLGEATHDGIRLVLIAAELLTGEPAALVDHDELRWLTPAQLPTVNWLPVDRVLLATATEHLLGRIRSEQ